MKEGCLTSTWKSPCFKTGGHATSAPCAESKIRKRFMPGTILKVFTSLVTSATIVTIARKHLKPRMLSAPMCQGCTNIRNCDALIKGLPETNRYEKLLCMILHHATMCPLSMLQILNSRSHRTCACTRDR